MKKSMIIAVIAMFILDYFKFDFAYGRYSSFILFVIYIFEGIFLVLILIFGMYILFKKEKRKRYALLFLISAIFILYICVLPYTNIYIKTNVAFFEKQRVIISNMIESDKFNIQQINEDTYKLPVKYRLASHNSRVRYNSDKNEVLFYIRCGFFKTNAVIYSPDDNFSPNDFKLITYSKKVKKQWYTVVF